MPGFGKSGTSRMRLRRSSTDVTVTGCGTPLRAAPAAAPGESRPMRPSAATRRSSAARETPQDRLEHAAVAQIGDVDLAVEPRNGAEARLSSVLGTRDDRDLHPGLQPVR